MDLHELSCLQQIVWFSHGFSRGLHVMSLLYGVGGTTSDFNGIFDMMGSNLKFDSSLGL